MEFSVNHKIISRNFAGEETDFIEILDGVYKGVIFKYGRVEFPNINEIDETDELVLDFDFYILEDNNVDLSDRETFSQTVGNLLVELIMFEVDRKNLEKYLKEDDVDGNRENDIE